jgi:hypothetical protein
MKFLTTSCVLLTACLVDHAEPDLSEPVLTLGESHAAEIQSITPLGESPHTISDESEKRLVSATHELAHAGPETEHARLVFALEMLADALHEATPANASDEVRHSAEELDRSWSRSIARGDVVRTGLEGAGRALATLQPPSSERARYRDALVAATQATTTIDPKRPVVEQYDAIAIAFRDTVTALFTAIGRDEPELAEAH